MINRTEGHTCHLVSPTVGYVLRENVSRLIFRKAVSQLERFPLMKSITVDAVEIGPIFSNGQISASVLPGPGPLSVVSCIIVLFQLSSCTGDFSFVPFYCFTFHIFLFCSCSLLLCFSLPFPTPLLGPPESKLLNARARTVLKSPIVTPCGDRALTFSQKLGARSVEFRIYWKRARPVGRS